MTIYNSKSLSNAVAAICPDILALAGRPSSPLDERQLWWELSSCILSSQVSYALAVAAADAIDTETLLLDKHPDSVTLSLRLTEVLRIPLSVDGRRRAYRFPVARARQLAATHAIVMTEACSLRELVDGFYDAAEARAWLVSHLPGVGPKQASMFLRNAGVSYNLAILDRHVLNYMSAVGIFSGQSLSIACLPKYCGHEAALRDYADELDCPVGILDWAIWIVMRVANQKMEPVAI